MNNRLISTTILFFVLVFQQVNAQNRPQLFAKNEDRQAILEKIENEEWAASAWKRIKENIDVYVDRHQTDPEWIVSRMSMYWKDGERYTQCYIKKQNWDYGEGNAPIPTVRLPGMRTWNSYINVPLEDRLPYSENGDMLAIDRASDDKTPVLVPYKKTGHMIRYNNNEILTLAEEAAFAYWITQEEKYAEFSADIFWTWLLGTYYMEPPLDPEKSTGGYGGYEPRGIMGYYDYEQIHDDHQQHGAFVYDFLYDYLKANPHEHLEVIGKDVVDVAGVVFKRFVDLGLVRGGKRGNWNVNGYKNIVPSMLILESNEFYEDGKGKEYYIPYYTEITTDYHEALPDFIKNFDEVTGLWPESPGYASGMISAVLDIGMPLYNAGINTIGDNPLLQKAAMANLGWLDARGNLVLFGDMRGGPTNFSVFERMLAYYTWQNEPENAKKMATVIRKGIVAGQYNRSKSNWKGLCLYQPLPESGSELPYHKAAYSEHHRHLIMKNGNSEENGLMFTLYGGKKGGHLTDNGLCMQFYGNGYVLNPDASAYESYWSDDAKYHRGIAGSNTIVPGYKRGEITINAMDPVVDETNSFYNTSETSATCSFADVSADEKRRLVAMVRTSPSTGYYVDVFRSNQNDNDNLQHVLGNEVVLKDARGKVLNLEKVAKIDNHYHEGYAFFENLRLAKYDEDFVSTWTTTQVESAYHVDMWMMGQDNREIYIADAPPSTLRTDLTPGGVNRSPQPTPTMILRQTKNNAQTSPFVAVFDAYSEGEKAIGSITNVASNEGFVCIEVDSKKLGKQLILNAIDKENYKPEKQVEFQGTFGIISEVAGKLDYLYLGSGKVLKKGKVSIEAVEGDVAAELRNVDGKYFYSANKPVTITTEKGKAKTYPAGEDLPVE
ncbi:hypothetical protein R9C00_19460 [Flammeovirgaceae bacterium SG7u.111]|nr:hypothetical protein [Flammeovirgaceae bacterium SG7u.132]WPO33880.1 hypothetical protein R9C00_19460 [Flammeovirgaceae bacterium SG7u.111]